MNSAASDAISLGQQSQTMSFVAKLKDQILSKLFEKPVELFVAAVLGGGGLLYVHYEQHLSCTVAQAPPKSLLRLLLLLLISNILQATYLIYLRLKRTPKRVRNKYRLNRFTGISHNKKTGNRVCTKCLLATPPEISPLVRAPVPTDWATHWRCLKCDEQYAEPFGAPAA
jgi:hypothetical protein